MAQLIWDASDKRSYEIGIDRCVLYLTISEELQDYIGYADNYGVPWNGVTGITENYSEGTSTRYYYNGKAYAELRSPKEFSATLKAFTYPDQFMKFDGFEDMAYGFAADEQPADETFSLSYRTKLGNGQASNAGYKIHILYNVKAKQSNKDYATQGGGVNLTDFSWDLTGVPLDISTILPEMNGSVHFVLDSRKIPATALAKIEKELYGDSGRNANLPPIEDLLKLVFYMKDNGDGTVTITGDSSIVQATADPTQYNINWPGIMVSLYGTGDTVRISTTYEENPWLQ